MHSNRGNICSVALCDNTMKCGVMMSEIYIDDLVIEAKHGVHEHEKLNSQNFCVSVALTVDTTKAGLSDDLHDTIDWSTLRDTIIATVQNNCFNLIERLAQEIASQILVDKRVSKVVVSVDKLDAFENGIPGIKLEVDRTN